MLPLARADAQDEAALELPVDQEPVWKDCHGHASNLAAQSSPASLRARVGTRLVVDQQHGYAWIAVGSSEGVLSRFRLDGEKLEAIATSPDLDSQHIVASRGLRTARVGTAEIVFRPIDLSAAVDLDLKPAAPVRAEGWQAYISQGDADFSGYGNILTRYSDARQMMVVTNDWSVSDAGLSVEETWWPKKGSDSLSFTRRYVLRNGEIVAASRKVPR